MNVETVIVFGMKGMDAQSTYLGATTQVELGQTPTSSSKRLYHETSCRHRVGRANSCIR
jgi:hypothetical protein